MKILSIKLIEVLLKIQDLDETFWAQSAVYLPALQYKWAIRWYNSPAYLVWLDGSFKSWLAWKG